MSSNGIVSGFMRRPSGSSSTGAPKMDYVKLQSRSNSSSFPPPHKTQLPPRYHLSPNPGGTGATMATPFSWKRRFWTFLTLMLVAFAAFYVFSLVRGSKNQQLNNRGYAVIIDAGSTGSRIHIFRYRVENSLPHVDTKDMSSLKAKPGLSSFATNPDKAGNSLDSLLEFANGKIPEADRSQTRVYLMATAGLRRLDVDVREKILQSCRAVLRSSDFMFMDSWASVISGTDEGAFAWVSANYALGTLGGNPRDTTGIVELGGASAQVTFVPDVSPPPEFMHPLEFGGVKYELYTYSFLDFGQEAAWETLFQLLLSGAVKTSFTVEDGVVVDPCTPAGYAMGPEVLRKHSLNLHNPVSAVLSAGNFSECRRVALELLDKGKDQCLHPRCAIGATFVPKLRGKIFATENFFYTSEFFGLPATTSLAEVETAGRFYCGEDWEKLKEKHAGTEDDDLLKYCFSTAYIVALLHDRLGIAMNDKRVRFTNKVGEVPLDWAMGALLTKLAGIIGEQQQAEWRFGDDWVTILSFFGSFGLFVVIVWLIVRCRKPRLKTIYDLEKGRYIVTPAARFR